MSRRARKSRAKPESAKPKNKDGTKSEYSKIDKYGFERSDDFNYELYDDIMSDYWGVLIRRELRWKTFGEPENATYIKNNTLKRFVRKGIPSSRRCAVWVAVSGAARTKADSPYTYEQLKQRVTNNEITETIRIDLPRTFPDNVHLMPHQQLVKNLFNVLATFAHQNAAVGYCQGMNYFAGLLLLATGDEEATFWLLKVLVEQILPPYYIKSMAGLLTELDVLSELVQKAEPDLHRHIQNIGMPWAMCSTKWFICLYSEVLPVETVLRIWDCLFYEGSKILFRVALTLIRLHKAQIMQTSELGELINCFKDMRNSKQVIDCHHFMADIFKLPGSFPSSKIENLRKKYKK